MTLIDPYQRADEGHNQPPPFDRLSLRIEELLSGARKVAVDHPVIEDQETADRLKHFKDQLTAALREAEKTVKEERKPFLEQANAVSAKWTPAINMAVTALAYVTPILEKALRLIEGKRRAAEQEAQRKADEARRVAEEAAEKARQLAERAMAGELKGSKADPIQAQLGAVELGIQAMEADRDARALRGPAKVGGGMKIDGKTTKTAHFRTTYRAKIANPRAAMMFFANDERLLATLQQVADAAVRADHLNPPPGCEVIKEEKVV